MIHHGDAEARRRFGVRDESRDDVDKSDWERRFKGITDEDVSKTGHQHSGVMTTGLSI